MGHGFRSALRLAATVAAVAVVARATESALRAFGQPAVAPPRHRAVTGSARKSTAVRPTPGADVQLPAPSRLAVTRRAVSTSTEPHPFGPTLAMPCRSIGLEAPSPPTPVASAIHIIELEASGELDDLLSPTDRLLARRHASELAS